MRRSDDPQYSDDPEFRQLSESLSNQLFTLTSNISRLSNQLALLGTKRDTDRVRERVHDLLEESRDGFKEAGEGIKRIQAWEDVSVCLVILLIYINLLAALYACRHDNSALGFISSAAYTNAAYV